MSQDVNLARFAERTERVAKAHDARRHRSMARLTKEERVPGTGLPYGKLLLLAGMFVVLKALAIATLSEGSYRTHVMYLQTGNVAERLVGAALEPDRVSLALARRLSL